MKFFNTETITGDLILIRTNRPTPPACPVLAKSVAQPAPADPLWLTIILWLCAALGRAGYTLNCVRDSWPPPIWTENRAKLAILMFLAGVLASVILENVAGNYLEGVLGG